MSICIKSGANSILESERNVSDQTSLCFFKRETSIRIGDVSFRNYYYTTRYRLVC
jgi:hypothetical protein